MGRHGLRMVFPIDLKKKPWEQKLPLHNRWHPDIPPVAEVTVGEVFRVEMMDCSGGRITKEYSAEDIKHADLSILKIMVVLITPWAPSDEVMLKNVKAYESYGGAASSYLRKYKDAKEAYKDEQTQKMKRRSKQYEQRFKKI
ncbi:Formamidase [Camellia lanceoleosa]|uniref:Formamidase n=1 Tax=Camellia lanceoleosa TaxID=1840588 RepID=A0ACC0IZW9_9ERIC|nr:Formamidase [Camellia lanceoleosa]